MHFSPMARRILEQRDGRAEAGDRTVGLNHGLKLSGSNFGFACIAVCDGEVWDDGLVLAAKGWELRKRANQRPGESNEGLGWFGSEIRRGREAPHLTQRESKRRDLAQSGLNLNENALSDLIRCHERHKNRDVRGHAQMDRGIKAVAQRGDVSLGFRDADDECGFEH